jgi:hypothetical protein
LEDWSAFAHCRGVEPAVMVPHPSQRGRPNRDEEIALGYCVLCAVVEPCLNYAVAHEERGVWGGTTEAQRKARYIRCAECGQKFLKRSARQRLCGNTHCLRGKTITRRGGIVAATGPSWCWFHHAE